MSNDKPTFSIRHGVTEDLDALTGIYNHYIRETTATFDTHPFMPEARRGWLSHYAAGTPHQLWVAEDRTGLLGYASSSAFRAKPAYDTSVETTIYLHPERRSQGLGSALYTHLFAQLAPFALHRAYAGIALPNPASIALHEKFGFAHAGTFQEVGFKFGGYHDVAWYEKRLHRTR